MEALKGPRFWLLVALGLGALGIVYVIIAASVQPNKRKTGSALDYDQPLLTGEMAEFAYAFPPRGAPEIPFEHAGREISLTDFKGRTVLVNFWATWCAPCLKELPSLDALQGQYGGRDFEVVAIAADPRGPAAAQTYLDRLGIENLELYADPRLSIASAIGGANMLPVSIVYDKQGNEVWPSCGRSRLGKPGSGAPD